MTESKRYFAGLTLMVSMLAGCAVEEPELERRKHQAMEAVPDWSSSETYVVGESVVFDGRVYECIQDHVAQIGWEPSKVPALWVAISSSDEWEAQVAYAIGDEVVFAGLTYRALIAHTSQADWQPPNVPALWEQIGTIPELELVWPVVGQDGIDWVINNYVDLDRSSGGILDYQGEMRTSDQHFAVDIDISSFREQDQGIDIVAAAPGEVISLEEGQFDRNNSCVGVGPSNFVTIRTEEGIIMSYLHFRKDSISPHVAVGDIVAAGDILGEVGSSGCSTQPHLHFEIFGTDGIQIDPFEQGLWIDPPVYNAPLTIMDIMIKDGSLTSAEVKSSPQCSRSRLWSLGRWLLIGWR